MSLENSWKWCDLDVAALEAVLAESCFQFHFETLMFNYFIGTKKGRFMCPVVETVAHFRSLFGLSALRMHVCMQEIMFEIKGFLLGAGGAAPGALWPEKGTCGSEMSYWAAAQNYRVQTTASPRVAERRSWLQVSDYCFGFLSAGQTPNAQLSFLVKLNLVPDDKSVFACCLFSLSLSVTIFGCF